MKKNIYSIKKRFPSERKSIQEVEPILEDMRRHIPIPDDKYYGIVISLTEAVNNAIIHGNRIDNDKFVDFEIKGTKTEITFIISDQGTGFDPDAVPDPRSEENLLKDHGRGVFLMRSLMDSVHYDISGMGTTLTMIYKLDKKTSSK
ncbi:MAG: hypothetical protein QG635_506 [Bacteroidota bacterium]|nr:hypothetical protein [Bacteroidota bacterium]